MMQKKILIIALLGLVLGAEASSSVPAEKIRRALKALQSRLPKKKSPALIPGRRLDAHIVGNLLETAVANGDFTTLVAAITAAGLGSALEGEGPLTIVAPNNKAFADTFQALGVTAEEALANPALSSILTYHAVAGKVMAANVTLMDGMEVETLQGEKFTVKMEGDSVKICGSDILPCATVVATDIEATNGVIHVIDMVLIPPTVGEALKAMAAEGGGGGGGNMVACMGKCPDMETMGELGDDYEKICTVVTCLKDNSDDCSEVTKMVADSSGGMMDCICDANVIGVLPTMMKAEETGGVCEEEGKAGEDGVDVCTLDAASECAKTMAGAMTALKDTAACKTMVDGMTAGQSDDEKKCVDDVMAAVKAADAPAADGAADFAARTMAPVGALSAGLLMLLLGFFF